MSAFVPKRTLGACLENIGYNQSVQLGPRVDVPSVAQRGGGNTLPETPSLNVLVIDDEESHASLVSRVFRKNGYDVAVTHSAEDGLAKLEGRDFDLIITDIFMEGTAASPGSKGSAPPIRTS